MGTRSFFGLTFILALFVASIPITRAADAPH